MSKKCWIIKYNSNCFHYYFIVQLILWFECNFIFALILFEKILVETIIRSRQVHQPPLQSHYTTPNKIRYLFVIYMLFFVHVFVHIFNYDTQWRIIPLMPPHLLDSLDKNRNGIIILTLFFDIKNYHHISECTHIVTQK